MPTSPINGDRDRRRDRQVDACSAAVALSRRIAPNAPPAPVTGKDVRRFCEALFQTLCGGMFIPCAAPAYTPRSADGQRDHWKLQKLIAVPDASPKAGPSLQWRGGTRIAFRKISTIRHHNQAESVRLGGSFALSLYCTAPALTIGVQRTRLKSG